MPLIYEKKSNRSNLYELKVRCLISQLAVVCITLESFENNFKEELASMSKSNVSAPKDWYKIVHNNNSLEVWHYNLSGELDRLIAIIKQQ